MSKQRSKVCDYAVYLVIRIVVCIVQALPYRAGLAFAQALAWLAYRIDARHRAVAHDNLRHAFPGRFDDAQQDEVVRAVYRHFCTLVIDIMHLPRKLSPHTWRRHLEIPQISLVVDCLLSNRPAMLVTGHFGNWEAGGYTLALLGFATHAIARPLDNPYVDDFLRRFREATGQKILAKKGDFDEMQAILARGGLLGTLADQDAGQRGLFVDFFGRPASTHKAVALLALEYGVTLMVLGVRKLRGELRYELHVADVIRPEEFEGQPDAARAITQRYTAALERIVRLAPEQYFWLHRRWKHQPAAKKPRRAA
ncbi:MAG TPA: lysophospholipid acyltransferase family protein [Gemmataceae bacterium]|nr:lysophospholipid acyltransferase family protein [Gemmataceae bacterium]